MNVVFHRETKRQLGEKQEQGNQAETRENDGQYELVPAIFQLRFYARNSSGEEFQNEQADAGETSPENAANVATAKTLHP